MTHRKGDKDGFIGCNQPGKSGVSDGMNADLVTVKNVPTQTIILALGM
jgi:hypothetical protein